MSLSGVINGIVDEKLLDMNTAFIAKVVKFNSSKHTATLQPLGKVKAYGKEAKSRAVLTDIPICSNVFKMGYRDIWIPMGEGSYKITVPYKIDISAGDKVICVVCDRDISQALKGNNAVPIVGHHEIQNAVVVGMI